METITIENHPYYQNFDEILFEQEELLFSLNGTSVLSPEASFTQHQIYQVIHFSPENDTVQVLDDLGKSVWVEAEMFVSCEDMDEE